MYAPTITPSIEVTIGRETRLYHAFITTAPATVRRTGHGHAPHRRRFRTCRAWLRTRSRSDGTRKCIGAARAGGRHRTGLAARAISRTGLSLRARRSRARWREHAAALAVEPDRIARDGSRTRERIATQRTTRPGRTRSGHFSEGCHEHRSQDSPQRTTESQRASSRTQRFTSSTASSPASSWWASPSGNGGTATAAASRSRRASSSSTATSATSQLLRAIGNPNAQNHVRDLVLRAYEQQTHDRGAEPSRSDGSPTSEVNTMTSAETLLHRW